MPELQPGQPTSSAPAAPSSELPPPPTLTAALSTSLPDTPMLSPAAPEAAVATPAPSTSGPAAAASATSVPSTEPAPTAAPVGTSVSTALLALQQVAHPLVLNVSITFDPSKEQEATALHQALATAPDSVLQQTIMLNGSVNITGVTFRWVPLLCFCLVTRLYMSLSHGVLQQPA